MSMGHWANMRSMQRSRDVLSHRVKKGTLPRILEFARPYRNLIAIFIGAVLLDAAISSVSPLLLRGILDHGIDDNNRGLIIFLAVMTGLLAIFEAIVSLAERRISAWLGESLIFDLRQRVYRQT